jgi:hypothetical protein
MLQKMSARRNGQAYNVTSATSSPQKGSRTWDTKHQRLHDTKHQRFVVQSESMWQTLDK